LIAKDIIKEISQKARLINRTKCSVPGEKHEVIDQRDLRPDSSKLFLITLKPFTLSGK
jgi:hypothetical protein